MDSLTICYELPKLINLLRSNITTSDSQFTGFYPGNSATQVSGRTDRVRKRVIVVVTQSDCLTTCVITGFYLGNSATQVSGRTNRVRKRVIVVVTQSD